MRSTAAVGAAVAVTAVPMFTVVLLAMGSSATASCTTPPPQQTTTGMNQAIVTTAYAEATARGASARVMLALFEAGLDESTFRNLANSTVPTSLVIPNDGVGSDGTSVGYLQQQVGTDGSGTFGWGNVAQAMDPLHATDAFLDAAIPMDTTTAGDAATLAQAVQRSATLDGSNYRAYQAQATTMIDTERVGAPTSAPPALAPAARPVGKLSPASGAYVGTYSSTDGLNSETAIEAYFQQREALAGRNFAIQNFMPGWTAPLDSQLVRWDIAHDIIPLISWNTPGVTDQSITDGSQDALIKAQADRIKALPTDVFIRFDWEMNGNWFGWDGTHNGGQGTGPAAYVAMWRHVHDIFTAEGATNVAWVWTPSSASLPDTAWNAMTAYYPGDAYVDWVGEDDYNYGGTVGHCGGWNDFTSQLQPIYGYYAAKKPLMIGEMGSVDNLPGHDKGQWITQMAADVKAHYPDVQALVWFDVKYDADWRFDTSPSSLQAFKAWLADPYYNPSSLATGPGTGCGTTANPLPNPGGPLQDPGPGPQNCTAAGTLYCLRPRAANLYDVLQAKWDCSVIAQPVCIHGYEGWRASDPVPDHPDGRAVDFNIADPMGTMPTAAQIAFGWQIAYWLQENTQALGIDYVIWQAKIWSVDRASEGWREYCASGSCGPYGATNNLTELHMDHLHVSVRN